MFNNQTYTAIVPVREGSRRLIDKNIYPFNGTTLLENKINQLKQVPEIDSIVVSSDSEKMLELALKNNVLIHKRSWEYCDEKTKTFGEVVENICSEIIGDHAIWSTVTSPLVIPPLYSKAINLYAASLQNGFDSLLTVEAFQKYILNNRGPLNYKFGVGHVPSQQLEVLYFKTNGIMIAPRLDMIKWKYLYGPNHYKLEIDKVFCADVDDILDMVQAECWLRLIEDGIYVPQI